MQKLHDAGASFDELNTFWLPKLAPVLDAEYQKAFRDLKLLFDPAAPSLSAIH